MYQAWKADPKSVHKSWDVYFRTNSVSNPPPTLGEIPAQGVGSADLSKMLQLLNNLPQLSSQSGNVYQSATSSSEPVEKLVEDHLKLYALIRSYQVIF